MHSKAKGITRAGSTAELNQSSQDLVASILKTSTASLEEEEERRPAVMRWELGACWVQHLQSEAATLKEKKEANAKDGSEKAAPKPATEQSQSGEDSAEDAGKAAPELAVPEELMKYLPSCALARLNESASLLQCKVHTLIVHYLLALGFTFSQF